MEHKKELGKIIKITVTKEAGEKLDDILKSVNEGFAAGKINRQDITSWIISKFGMSFSDSEIQQIRKEFFSEKILLEEILKKVKSSGNVPEFLSDALRKYWSGSSESLVPSAPGIRRSAKNSTSSKNNNLVNQATTESGV